MVKKENAWLDKYSTSVYRNALLASQVCFEIQPTPDYVRWFKSERELHYLTTEKTKLISRKTGALKKNSAIFLPSKLLHHSFTFDQNPPDDVLYRLTFLCWLPIMQIDNFFIEMKF